MRTDSYGQKLIFIIRDQDNQIVDLTTASSVKLYINLAGITKEKNCVIESPTEGQVSYTIEEEDFDLPGVARLEVEVNFPGQSFVNENSLKETIHGRIKLPEDEE